MAPEVLVLDAQGAPVSGIDVSFAVTAGGGSVRTAAARTDAAGHASSGGWTLGAAKGSNRLSATVQGLASVTFTAKALSTSAAISVSPFAPTAGAVVGSSISIAVTVSSTYQLASVSASIGASSAPLSYGTLIGRTAVGWGGVLPAAQLPQGPAEVIVTATDVFANSTDLIVPVQLDRVPSVAVTLPQDGSLARPKTEFAATCADDAAAGCVSLMVSVDGTTLATSSTGVLSRSLDLSAYEGRSITLAIVGTDAIGQTAASSRVVYVESSSHLLTVAEVGGPVTDAGGARVLFVDSSTGVPALQLRDLTAGTTQTLETGDVVVATFGFLTTGGALYEHQAPGPTFAQRLYEWRAGAVSDLGRLASPQSLRVAGDKATYSALDPVRTLMSRDLVSGISQAATTDAANGQNDVAANGDIAYWTFNTAALGYNVYRLRNGVARALTADPAATTWNTSPITDGVNVVYIKITPCCALQTYRIAMHDGTTEKVLSVPQTSAGLSYAAAGGFVAYTSRDAVSPALQVWRHGPEGERQLSFFGISSTIDALAPDGTVIFSNSGRRYRAKPGADLQDVGSALGRVVYRDGRFLILLGRSVLELGA
jgi:hypothetical protein